MVLFMGLSGNKALAQGLGFLIPDAAIAQYAGSIGYFSGGVGYDIFKNKRGNIDLMYGFVPGNKGGVLHAATAKFAYRPFVYKIKDWAIIYPINPGFFVSYTFHRELSTSFNTDQYPKKYYYWSEAIRPHLSFSNEIELNAGKLLKGAKIKSITLYSEFNTNEYYLVNYLQNIPALTLSDVMQLGIGTRIKF